MAQAPASSDAEQRAHKAWLGLVQPVGLVVSPLALSRAQVVLDKHIVPIQQALQAVVVRPASVHSDADPRLLDFPRCAVEVLGWSPQDLAGAPDGPPLPDSLAVALPDYGETLRPSYAVLDTMAQGQVLLLVQVVASGSDLDKAPTEDARTGFSQSPQARFERLLRDTGVSAGLLLNGSELRLCYAPRGESSGHLGFPIAAMCTVSGRPLLAALHMLLCEHRVVSAQEGQRLIDLLRESRKYQSEVSNRLAEQVLSALWDLLRGFQAADEAAQGRVLHNLPRQDPQQIYGGLLTVIMRLVFLLYAEDQGLLPSDPVYAKNYAIGGLFERLRKDAGLHPDTLDQRFGAYAWLLATFRMVFDGGAHGILHLPARHGQLFNPDEYPFLEGRAPHELRVLGDSFEAPRVSDGVIWRVLKALLVLDGERLSYRALDVEQVGSVYESMMGFEVKTLPGRALSVRPKGVVFDVDALLALPPPKRAAWLKEQTECELGSAGDKALKEAKTAEDVAALLGKKLAPPTPAPLPPGTLFLQPGEERRRSGSHYTPRELTAPIVATTLRPVLAALGDKPTPEQILDLAVCDPAMGSGAFLVESCRQLAFALCESWLVHGNQPKLPPDEDPLLHARRLVAQRCLYGVDKNRFAVNLAKLSLWLVTLAKDHAFTFLDHALKHGDSLCGLTRAQIGAFHWQPPTTDFGPLFQGVASTLDAVSGFRQQIQRLGEGEYDERGLVWQAAEDVVEEVRHIGDLCLCAYFSEAKDKDRETRRRSYLQKVNAWKQGGDRSELDGLREELRQGESPVLPLHWEIEFPEVFARKNPGFDAMVGNPPFLGGGRISGVSGRSYLDWILALHPDSHGNADLVAHFFRRSFSLLRQGGSFGLIATNTIAQGDTRSTGLRFVCTHGGEIYAATRRFKWPGLAAVVVSVVHVHRGPWTASRTLDGREVPFISAYLFHGGGHDNPQLLKANAGQSFLGSKVYGQGFTFDDTDQSGEASSLSDMQRLIAKDPRNAERIFPYLGGEEVNTSPTHAHHRYVIHFGELSEEEARRWPDLLAIVEAKVKPGRLAQNREIRARYWWRFGETTPALFRAIAGLERVLTCSLHSKDLSFAFLPAKSVFSHALAVFPLPTYAAFAALQSRIHEVWARFFGSSMKDDLRYTPSDCFETFPFPLGWQSDPNLEAVGQQYYDFRATLMVERGEGLTKIYNRFHDQTKQDDPQIVRLQELHAAMDRAVLSAYGFTDIQTDCNYLPDYEIDDATWPTDKKKPYRYRWPDSVRDEVLARLLDLNKQRHQEESLSGRLAPPDKPAPTKPATPKPKKPKAPPKAKAQGEGTLALFGPSREEEKN